MAKKDDLTNELIALGMTAEELEGKTNPELEALLEEKAPKMTPEEIAELKRVSDEAEKKLKEKKDSQPKTESRTYTQDEMKAILSEFKKELIKDMAAENEPEDDDGPRKHSVRMARINNKFVLGFKNLNNDPYFPERVIYSQDIFNEQTKQFVPHVTLILEDDETVTLPLETALKVCRVITCDLVERKTVDISKKFGQIEVQEMKPDQYGMTGTGNFIQGKQKMFKETYVVRLPNGKLVEVIPDVVNWKNTARQQ